MRHILTLLMALTIGISALNSCGKPNPKKVETEIKQKEESNLTRSSSPYIEIFYHSSTLQVEVNHAFLGDIHIYVTDAQNEMVSQTNLTSETPQTTWLEVPNAQAHYTITIESPTLYVTGNF